MTVNNIIRCVLLLLATVFLGWATFLGVISKKSEPPMTIKRMVVFYGLIILTEILAMIAIFFSCFGGVA